MSSSAAGSRRGRRPAQIPADTAARLLVWIDNDPYGFCYHLEKDAATAFGQAGLAAFERQIRARFDAAAQAKPEPAGSFRSNPDDARGRWGEVLRTLYVAQKNIAVYVALSEETGLTAQDCHVIASLLMGRRKPEEALAWVERGIEIDKKTPHGSTASHDLAELQRELLTRLGRGGEALEAAWAEYHQHPSKYTYEDLMKFVPIAERTFQAIQETRHKTHLDADVPREVRQRAREASVRARQDWHRDAIRAVFNSGDEAWQLTATFCMRFMRGFEEETLAALERTRTSIRRRSVQPAIGR